MRDGADQDGRGGAAPQPSGLFRAICLGFAIGNLAILIAMAGEGSYLRDAAGEPIAADFLGLRTAGRMALDGRAAAMYDAGAAKIAETLMLGRDFSGVYAWPYPPLAFLLVAPLALGSAEAAQIAWTSVTLGACLLGAWRIEGRSGPLAVLAIPAALPAVAVGQNGFLTAALLGGGLLFLHGRPILAGILIGLLAYKPQFGLLIPLALAAGGHRRAIAAAGLSIVILTIASLASLGVEPWIAFLVSVPRTAEMLGEGTMGFGKLQSAYGLVRSFGGPASLAWTCQGLVSAAAAHWVWRTWRGGASFALRSAALICAAALATPYLYLYDLVILAPAIAFLARGGLSRRDIGLVGSAFAALLVVPLLGHSAGLAATALITYATALRIETSRPDPATVQPPAELSRPAEPPLKASDLVCPEVP